MGIKNFLENFSIPETSFQVILLRLDTGKIGEGVRT